MPVKKLPSQTSASKRRGLEQRLKDGTLYCACSRPAILIKCNAAVCAVCNKLPSSGVRRR